MEGTKGINLNEHLGTDKPGFGYPMIQYNSPLITELDRYYKVINNSNSTHDELLYAKQSRAKFGKL